MNACFYGSSGIAVNDAYTEHDMLCDVVLEDDDA